MREAGHDEGLPVLMRPLRPAGDPDPKDVETAACCYRSRMAASGEVLAWAETASARRARTISIGSSG